MTLQPSSQTQRFRRPRYRRPYLGENPAGKILAVALSTAFFIALTASPVAADWLVTRDGKALRTQGEWEVKGALVVFTQPTGKLASIRLSEVNLEASRALTKRALQEQDKVPEPAAQPEPRKATVIITDKDMTRLMDEEPAAEEAASPDDSEPDSAGPADLVVTAWDRDLDETVSGLVVTGQIKNQGSNLASNVQLEVILFDAEGQLLSSQGATLTSPVLPAGRAANFTASFPGIYEFSAARFDIERVALRTREDSAEQPSTEDEVEQ